jgi:hypothetical protein
MNPRLYPRTWFETLLARHGTDPELEEAVKHSCRWVKRAALLVWANKYGYRGPLSQRNVAMAERQVLFRTGGD